MFKPITNKAIKNRIKQIKEESKSSKEIVFLLQDIDDPINVGSFFRLVDALNAQLLLSKSTPRPPSSGISLTSRGLERRVNYSTFEDIKVKIAELKASGFQIIAVELTEDSVDYSKFSYGEKVCLILGNEARGVYKSTLELVEAAVHIPMLGKGPSLNVNMAAAIVGYQIISK